MRMRVLPTVSSAKARTVSRCHRKTGRPKPAPSEEPNAMNLRRLLLLFASLAAPPALGDTEADVAKMVVDWEGEVIRDENAPGRPVVAVTLGGAEIGDARA